MQKNFKIYKSGVSLIAVLMFMLIATIAATATWKWISNEGFSSASRMLQREAYQSSIAGIENARAWMTFHANDVGALIKQFVEDENHRPINIDNRLRPIQRAGQNYHVWLTGVNTENSTYKLKIISSGESRNNARHTEVAIFNVDGLYRVSVPSEKTLVEIDYNYAYVGGSTELANNSDANSGVESMLVYGDLSGREFRASKDLIVTGNVGDDNTNNFLAGERTCVRGNLTFNQEGFASNGGDLYVGGNAIGLTMKTGAKLKNAYFNGNVQVSNLGGGGITFDGNVTVNGNWTSHSTTKGPTHIVGNLCLSDDSQLDFATPSNSSQGTFIVDGSVWIPKANALLGNLRNPNDDKYQTVTLGNSANSELYIQNGVVCGSNYFVDEGSVLHTATVTNYYANYPYSTDWTAFALTDCPVDNPYFYQGSDQSTYDIYLGDECSQSCTDDACVQVNCTQRTANHVSQYTAFTSLAPKEHLHSVVTGTPTITCAENTITTGKTESIKTFCETYFNQITKTCPGGKDSFDDILQTAADSYGSMTMAPCVRDILNTPTNDLQNGAVVNRLNACYTTSSEKQKYNDYLVLKANATWMNAVFSNANSALEGKYIFYVDEEETSTNKLNNVKLPPTTDKGFVFLYLPNGAGVIDQSNANGNSFNYFVYSLYDIAAVQSTGGPWSGSFYLSSANCAKVLSFSTGGATKLEFNRDFVTDLSSSHIICPASETVCGDEVVGGVLIGGAGGLFTDDYYVSMAPQLGVSLESQSKSRESLPPLKQDNTKEGPDLDSSFIILPRVLSLPNDPYGTLEDYINVLPLNGSHLTKDKLSLSGCTALSGTTGVLSISAMDQRLYSPSGNKLSKGNYRCDITAQNYSDVVPVWIIVGESQRRVPVISFEEPSSQKIGPSETKTVRVTIDPSPRSLPITLNVYCPTGDIPNWNYVAEGNTGSGSNCVFTIPADEDVVELFTVTTSNAVSGTLQFQLMPGEGYNIGQAFADVHMASTATLNRQNVSPADISAYCETHSADCPADPTDWPDCNLNEKWVEPVGTSFIEDYRNLSWSITVGGSGTVDLTATSDKCVVIVPPNQERDLSTLVAGQSYVLKASAKAKHHELKVRFMGDVGDGKNPSFNVDVTGRIRQTVAFSSLPSNKTAAVDVYGDQLVKLSIDKSLSDNENFSYWKCFGPSCPTHDAITSSQYDAFEVRDDATIVYVYFGQSDKHCFFEEFKNSTIACGSSGSDSRYCIDNCSGNCESAGESGRNYVNSKWHLLSGSLNDFETSESGRISVKKGEDVLVMSTVNAGVSGTLKALVMLPRAGGSSADNVRNTGFLLRSNENASEYLMLNVYIDDNDVVAARVCTENGSCQSGFLTRNSIPLYSSSGKMVMIFAKITRSDELTVSAFEGNYYGSPLVYTKTFTLSRLSNTYHSPDHEYVGYRMSNPNFKLYGIGWASDEYASECFDAPPTVKCSFAAKAANGIIPLETEVVPWVGHSGWFDSREFSCQTKFYYYNGNDAGCGSAGNGGLECSNGYYKFTQEGAGSHGYKNSEGEDVKTAKAGIQCVLGGPDGMWAADPEDSDNGEQNRAHCGAFWTGLYSICTQNVDLSYSNDVHLSPGEERSWAFTKSNLREASLEVFADNPDNSEVEVWLYSESDRVGDELYPSLTQSMDGDSKLFDVVEQFAGSTSGFDPENVVQIAFVNKGEHPVTIRNVITVCPNVVGVESCNAKREGDAWIIDATINNIDNVNQFSVAGVREADPGQTTSSNWEMLTTASGVSRESACGAVVTDCRQYKVTIPAGNDATTPGKYSFTLSLLSDNSSIMHTKKCSVEKPDVKSVRCEVKNDAPKIGIVKPVPDLHVVLHDCPDEGCGDYEVLFNGEKLYDGSCPAPRLFFRLRNHDCDIKHPAATGTGTYTVRSKATTPLFECRDISIATPKTPITVTRCPYSVQNQDPTSFVSVNLSVKGCEKGCSYSVSSATADGSGTGYKTGNLTFYNVNGSGRTSHTLTLTNAEGSTATCAITVDYVTSSSSTTTSSSTLTTSTSTQPETSSSSVEISSSSEAETSSSMVTTSTSVETSTSTATTSTSVETSTSVMTSSSAAGVQTIVGNQFPQQIDIPSGTCMSLKGTWTADHQAPIVLRCNATGSMTIKYGNTSQSGDYYVQFDFGTKTSYSATEVTFVSNVCITSNASELKCGFGTK